MVQIDLIPSATTTTVPTAGPWRVTLDGALREHNPPDASTLCPDLPT